MSNPKDCPPRLAGRDWHQNTIGRSGADVYRLRADGHADVYVKSAPTQLAAALHSEAARLTWLEQIGYPAAPVEDLLEHAGRVWLVTGALTGADCAQANATPEAKIAALAAALRRLHQIDPATCPIDESLDVKLAKATARVALGGVDTNDFDDHNVGKSSEDLLAEITASRPETEHLVVTHGDASLPNFILRGDQFTGVIDCGRLGLADAYQDLGLIRWSIGYNLGQRWIAPFFAAYGLPDPDPAKLRFYKSLDEFA